MHIIKNVTAHYPHLDQPYKWSDAQNRTMPCSYKENGAAYDLQWVMSGGEAKRLMAAMEVAYEEDKKDGWPKSLNDGEIPFKKQEDKTWLHKATLEAAYQGEETKPPKQFDSKNNELPKDFRLTTGSTINVQVSLHPWSRDGNSGVKLRVRQVQVIQYKPEPVRAAFDVVEDGFTMEDVGGSAFTAVSDDSFGEEPAVVEAPATEAPKKSAKADAFGDDDEEVVAEPKKKVVKKSAPAKAEKDEKLASVLDEWFDD